MFELSICDPTRQRQQTRSINSINCPAGIPLTENVLSTKFSASRCKSSLLNFGDHFGSALSILQNGNKFSDNPLFQHNFSPEVKLTTRLLTLPVLLTMVYLLHDPQSIRLHRRSPPHQPTRPHHNAPTLPAPPPPPPHTPLTPPSR